MTQPLCSNVLQAAHAVQNDIPRKYWNVLVRANELIASTPGARDFIEENREVYGPEFMEFVDDLTGSDSRVGGFGIHRA